MWRPSPLWACVLALAGLLAIHAAKADKLDELIDSVEAVVNKVADQATEKFRRRFPTVAECECSHHACGSKFGTGDTCHEDIGDAVLWAGCSGQKLDFNESFILTAPTTDVKADELAPDVVEAICTFREMDDVFSSARDEFGIRAWSYVATTNGVMRNWPGHAHERGDDVDPDLANPELRECKKYEPRIRPWYVAASSGPKDVVLVIDTSGSMNESDDLIEGTPRTRWAIVKEAILSLLDTFSISDYINIVEFNTKAVSVIPGTMVHGTAENIELMKAELDKVFPEGGTDFRLGLNEAFNLLIAAAESEDELATSKCQKVIIFMTDGKDCTTTAGEQECAFETPENRTPVDSVLDLIEKKQKELEDVGSQRAHIFPFSFGFDADDEIPKEMACANEGVWGRILSEDDPLFKMNSYTSYLATKRGDADVIWSRIYDDEFGLGKVVTAAKPIYSPKTSFGEDGTLVGVVGHDVRLEDFQALVPEFLVAIRRFILRGIQCIDTEFSGCELQLLRGKDAECPEVLKPADCYFFGRTGDYYITPDDQLFRFEEAEKFCQDMGGALAEIDEPREEDLLAGLALNAGSWVGLTRDEETRKWRWRSSGIEVPEDSEIWVRLVELNSEGKECATLDRRGVRHSVHPEVCSTPTRAICEFTSDSIPDVCKTGKVIRVDDEYDYNVRPLSTCRREEEEILAATALSPAAGALPRDRVICPLGEAKTTFDVRCCDECEA